MLMDSPSPLLPMKSFLNNPTEYFLNLFGYTMQRKPSLLLMSMLDFTHETYFEGIRRQGRQYEFQKYIH